MKVDVKKARLLNDLYGIARKKDALTDEERLLVKTAARMLERAMGVIRDMKAHAYEIEEQLAIMLEGNGVLKGDGGGFPPSDEELPEEDSWDDGWPIVGYPTR